MLTFILWIIDPVPRKTQRKKQTKKERTNRKQIKLTITCIILQDIIIGGDFNAGGKYVRDSDWDNIRLRTDTERFHWVIGDDVDTTIAGKADEPIAYDR